MKKLYTYEDLEKAYSGGYIDSYCHNDNNFEDYFKANHTPIIPTLKEVKKYFKNVTKANCAFDGTVFKLKNYDLDKIYYNTFGDGSILIPPLNPSGTNQILFLKGKWAEIIKYKKL